MLEIKNITKVYKTEGFTQKALDNVSISFSKCEFTSILGPSGSGKTTLLNIIGGLDHYTKGDLIINGTSTKKFKDSDWDSYRNHRIGFVFQNYNLISHQTILSNVKLALTLSGISSEEATERAKKALDSVGLSKHINKRPAELSGGQMQRVAIARALVNDPDILLADEPTGALDSETSIQIMELLKDISRDKLVIMVTHNPELAEKYSNRIITLKDGHITSDSNPFKSKKQEKEVDNSKSKKTSMKFKTALSLSFNNLMTKKGRTILVSLAGSIGIIGIALILSVSTGFQRYVDSIAEETLTSYPLTIYNESSDVTGALLAMTSNNSEKENGNIVHERQFITSMLSSVSTNDLKSFKTYLEKNYSKVENDLRNVKYSYSIDPLIYTKDENGNAIKLNPSNLFSSMMGNNSMLSSYSSYTSIYSQMIDDKELIYEQYDILKGRLPDNYDEALIVLSEPNGITDLLVYSLGLRDTKELNKMVTSIMSGESVDINNKPLELTYDDLLNVELKVINSPDTYKYNSKYSLYEDMSDNKAYMNELYNKSLTLKIVGIVSPKEGVNSMALGRGVSYTKELIEYLINNSSKTEIVKKQLDNKDIDVFSGKRFDSNNNNFNFSFDDFISIDNEKLKSAFNINIDKSSLETETKNYMTDINNSIDINTDKAREDYTSTFMDISTELIKNKEEINLSEVDSIVNNYNFDSKLESLENTYIIPKDTYKEPLSGLLKGLLNVYINAYTIMDNSLSTEEDKVATYNEEVFNTVLNSYINSAPVEMVIEKFSNIMTETKIKKEVLTKVSELTSKLTNTFASSFNIDESKIASAFKLNVNEDEIMRILNAMNNKKEKNATTNLIDLGYQDISSPSYISFYFNSFDGKEHFLDFIEKYNKKVDKDKVINYSDTTGILMNSVKTIVNAVSYVLIAFVSISLVVSSIMIGIITYISVYERTKEIGILRSIGASKRNISSIFNAETFIIGLLSGLFGITISYILIPLINLILHHYTGNIPLSARLNISSAIILIVLSIILTLIGGLIPAKSASKKDPVEALRSE